MTELGPFLEYINTSISSLNTGLHSILQENPIEYEVIYENFLQTIEKFKINMLNELKVHVPPSWMHEEKRKERVILHQMKNLVNTKIKK